MQEESIEYLLTHPDFFKKGYARSMGGVQTVVIEGVGSFDYDDRRYYSGRGKRYNKQSMHENLGTIFVSKTEIENIAKKMARSRFELQKESNLRQREWRRKFNIAAGMIGKTNLKEAIKKILALKNKAYYFIEVESGTYIMIFKAFFGEQVTIDVVDEEFRKKFVWEEWYSAPYAADLGMNPEDKNLFVC